MATFHFRLEIIGSGEGPFMKWSLSFLWGGSSTFGSVSFPIESDRAGPGAADSNSAGFQEQPLGPDLVEYTPDCLVSWLRALVLWPEFLVYSLVLLLLSWVKFRVNYLICVCVFQCFHIWIVNNNTFCAIGLLWE